MVEHQYLFKDGIGYYTAVPLTCMGNLVEIVGTYIRISNSGQNKVSKISRHNVRTNEFWSDIGRNHIVYVYLSDTFSGLIDT